jgi:hypothetical protein
MYKARSITSKASSACKMNMALIEGDREVQKQMTKKVGFDEAAGAAAGALTGQKPSSGEQSEGGGEQSEGGGGQSEGAIEVDADTAPSPAPMRRSPAKLDPATIMKVASMASSVMGNKKKDSNGGGKQETKVVVNNTSSAPTSSGGNSQASNAIDPK